MNRDLANRYLWTCGKQASDFWNGKLPKPKCAGRVLRMMAMYYGVIQPMVNRQISFESFRSCLPILKWQQSHFQSQMKSKYRPKRLFRYVMCAELAHQAVFDRNSLGMEDFDNVIAHLRAHLGEIAVLRVNDVIREYQSVLLGTSH